MKAFVAVLCLCAVALAQLDYDAEVSVGQVTSANAASWTDLSLSTGFFNCRIKVTAPADKPTYTGKVEVRLIRRTWFNLEASALWLCKTTASCASTTSTMVQWNQTFNMVAGAPYYMLSEFTGGALGIGELLGADIKACEDHCEDECPSDCSGHGSCLKSLGQCFCDTEYHKSGSDCNSEGLDWLYLWIIIGVCGVAFIILLTIVLCCICCCCCCKD